MFESLEKAPPDAILGLAEAFNQDPNPEKINLTVGVYKDDRGQTPILECVKEAERRLLAAEASKGYLGIAGNPEFGLRVRRLLFGDDELADSGRAVSLQTPGGTGALRVAADFLKKKLPNARVWLSRPTWANHPGILAAADRQTESYAYLDADGTGLDFTEMMASIRKIPTGDVILLHACCHNPTGVDPTPEQWGEIAVAVSERQLLPLVDCAYQGFGDGVQEDVRGLRMLLESCHEAFVCSSFSKNFGLYGERIGCLTIVAGTPDAADSALSHAKQCVRTNYSNPPQHGAAIVATVLGDPQLESQWQEELTGMRERIRTVRSRFVQGMKDAAPDSDFSFIARQRGMFSYSGLNAVQVDDLRYKHSIYIVAAGGRINVAGITETNLPRLCSAIAAVL